MTPPAQKNNIFKSLSLKHKILFSVILTCIICSGISLATAIYVSSSEFHSGLVKKSQTIFGRLSEVTKFVANQGGLKTIIQNYSKTYKSPDSLTEEDKKIILQQVPIYASMKIASENADQEHYSFRVFSDAPRNKKNTATPEELAIFKKFEANPELNEIIDDNRKAVTVYRPIRIYESTGCLVCHGNPSTSPWHNGKDILGYEMENWKDGKLHGVFAISNDIKNIQASENKIFSNNIILLILIFIGSIFALICAYWMIKGPLEVISNIFKKLKQTEKKVSLSSQKINSSSQSLSMSTSKQASALTQTAAAIEELSSMNQRNSDSSRTAAQQSEASQEKATEGKMIVQNMILSMSEINQENQNTLFEIEKNSKKISGILQIIQDIESKTKIINEIVFQTKLLSFNASVEAARAGEAGKGFAVVAEEIENLAQMTGNASLEISTMLKNSMHQVESIILDIKNQTSHLLQKSQEKVSKGVNVANECDSILNEIVDLTKQVSQMAHEISHATEEQSIGNQEIRSAIHELDAATQANSGTSQENALEAQALSSLAKNLRSILHELHVLLEGHNHRP